MISVRIHSVHRKPSKTLGKSLDFDPVSDLAVKMSASRAVDVRFGPHLHHGSFSRRSHTNDLEIVSSMATLPGAWH